MQVNRFKLGILALLLGSFAFLIAKPINLFTADLGRHITNGKVLVTEGKLPKSNFYSYAQPDYPFVNHHWGSGVVFYFLDRLVGMTGLSAFFIGVSMLTLLCFVYLAIQISNFETGLFTALLLMPVLINRTEVRPEIFSNLFVGMEMLLLWMVTRKKWQASRLWLLPLIQLVWINLHIYFAFGFFIMGVFWLEDVITHRRFIKQLTLAMAVSLLVSLINPAFVNGLLYPTTIFREYGYRLFENMSVVFLDKLIGYEPNFYFKFSQLLLVAALGYAVYTKRRLSLALTIVSALFSYLAWNQVRNFTLYAFVLIPVIASFLGNSIKLFNQAVLAVFGLGILFWLMIFNTSGHYKRYLSPSLGLLPNTYRSVEFFKANKLRGPIFNNYDIGGFLIYSLFPQEKVFVDNRPEAYSVSFFQDMYIPMQEKPEVWQKYDSLYHFNTIFFYRHDQTPWAQRFLISKVKDPTWAPVYVDDYVIMLVKRSQENKPIIDVFEIPASRFNVQ